MSKFGLTPKGNPRYRCTDGSGTGRLTVREKILKALALGRPCDPFSIREIAHQIGHQYGVAALELRRMAGDGEVIVHTDQMPYHYELSPTSVTASASVEASKQNIQVQRKLTAFLRALEKIDEA